MLIWEVASKYANALFLSVKDRGLIDEADEQFLVLRDVVVKDRKFLNVLTAPKLSEDQKLKLVRDVFGKRINRLLVEFLILLVRKRRINFLPEIIEEFDRRVKAEKGIYVVTAVTAVPLTDAEERQLRSKLAARFDATIELDKKVEPEIIGGMIIITHNEIIDGSVRYGLGELKEQLAQVRVF